MSDRRIDDILDGLEQIIRRLENLDTGLERTTERVQEHTEAIEENAEALDSAAMAARAQAQERKRLADAEREQRNKAVEEERDRQYALKSAYRDGIASLTSFMGALTSAEAGMSKYARSVEAGFEGLGNLAVAYGGKWGKLLQLGAEGLGALAAASFKLEDAVMGVYDSFAKLGTGGDLTTQELLKLADQAGYTKENMAEYAKIVKSVGPNLAALGGSAADGVRVFSDLAKYSAEEFKQYRRLGLTQTEYNQAQADSIDMLQRQGRIFTANFTTQDNLKKVSKEYIDSLLVLSNLTGMEADEAKKKMASALAENSLQLYLSEQEDKRIALLKKEEKLREEAAAATDKGTKARLLQEADATKAQAQNIEKQGKDFQFLVAQLSTFMSEEDLTGIKQMLGTGTVMSAESAKIFARMPKEAQQLVTNFRNGNKSAEEMVVEMGKAQNRTRQEFGEASKYSAEMAKFFGLEWEQSKGLRTFSSQLEQLTEKYKELGLKDTELLKMQRGVIEEKVKAVGEIKGDEDEQEAARKKRLKELEELREKADDNEKKFIDERIKLVKEFKPDDLATATGAREAAEIEARRAKTQLDAVMSPFLDKTREASEVVGDFATSLKDAIKEMGSGMSAGDMISAGVMGLALLPGAISAIKTVKDIIPVASRAAPVIAETAGGLASGAGGLLSSAGGMIARVGAGTVASGVLSAGMIGKDIIDIATAEEGEVKNEDIGGVTGGVIGGAIGTLIAPGIGTAIGAGIGNWIGENVGGLWDDEETPAEGEEVPVATPVESEESTKEAITAETQFKISLLEATDALDQFTKMLDSATTPLDSTDKDKPNNEAPKEDSTDITSKLAAAVGPLAATMIPGVGPLIAMKKMLDDKRESVTEQVLNEGPTYEVEPAVATEELHTSTETEFTTALLEATHALDQFTKMLDTATSPLQSHEALPAASSVATDQRTAETKRLSTMRETQTEREIKDRELELLEQYNNTIESLDLETWNLMETFVDLGKMLTETFGLDFLSTITTPQANLPRGETSFLDRLGSLFGITGRRPTAPRGAASEVPAAPTTPLPPGTAGLLEQIARGEGTSDEQAKKKGFASGYDVPLGYGKFGTPDKPLSEMTLDEVKRYQLELRRNSGSLNSSAVGKYQIVGDTLRELQKELKLSDDTKFDKETQDKMAEALLRRRGIDKLTSGQMSKEQFQQNLSKEWASIADPRTGMSYYGQHTGTSDAQAKAAIEGLSKPAEPTQVAEVKAKPTPEPTPDPVKQDADDRLQEAIADQDRMDKLVRDTAAKMGIKLGSEYQAEAGGTGSQQYLYSINGQEVPLELYSPEQLKARKAIEEFRAQMDGVTGGTRENIPNVSLPGMSRAESVEMPFDDFGTLTGGVGQEDLSGNAGVDLLTDPMSLIGRTKELTSKNMAEGFGEHYSLKGVSDLLSDPMSLLGNNFTNQSYAMDTRANEVVSSALSDARALSERITEQQSTPEKPNEPIPTSAPAVTPVSNPTLAAAELSNKMMGDLLSKMDTLIMVMNDSNSIQEKIRRTIG